MRVDPTRSHAARRPVTTVRVRALDGDAVRDRPDKVVTEEPMEIRVHGPGQEPRPLVVTMRTPGNDFELAVGFCRTENVLQSADDLDTVAYCLAGEGTQEYNIVTVRLRRPFVDDRADRPFAANAELRPLRQGDPRRGRSSTARRSPTAPSSPGR